MYVCIQSGSKCHLVRIDKTGWGAIGSRSKVKGSSVVVPSSQIKTNLTLLLQTCTNLRSVTSKTSMCLKGVGSFQKLFYDLLPRKKTKKCHESMKKISIVERKNFWPGFSFLSFSFFSRSGFLLDDSYWIHHDKKK